MTLMNERGQTKIPRWIAGTFPDSLSLCPTTWNVCTCIWNLAQQLVVPDMLAWWLTQKVGATESKLLQIRPTSIKLDGVAMLITVHPPVNSTTKHSRMVCQKRSLCPGGSAYLPGPVMLQ